MKNSSNIRELYFTYSTSAYIKKLTVKEIIFGNTVTNFIQIYFYAGMFFKDIIDNKQSIF